VTSEQSPILALVLIGSGLSAFWLIVGLILGAWLA